jgi:tetratricopeptide (TPR) repeat protein
MDQRTKRDHALINLVSEFELMSQKGNISFLEERDFFALINYYEDEYHIDRAIEVVDYALEQYKYRVEFYIQKIKLLMLAKRPEEALPIIDKAEIISPLEFEIPILRAKVMIELNQTEEALIIIRDLKVICGVNDKVELFLCEAHIHEQNRNFNEMFESLKNVLNIEPGNAEALEKIWVSVELSKNYNASVKFHSNFLDDNPYSFHAWYNLGHAYACLGEYRKAISALEYSFLSNEQFELGYTDCAEICLQIKDYKQALHIYTEALNVFGPDSELLVNIAQCYVELNQFKDAKKALCEAVEHDNYNDEIFYYLGRCFVHEENWVNAINAFHKAINIENRREEYYSGLANAYAQIGKHKKANHYFAKATETGPEQSTFWFEHASFLIQIGDTLSALDVLDEAEDHTFGADLIYCRAAALFNLGLKKQALEVLQEALDEDLELSKVLFKVVPDLEADEDIQSIIRYFTLSR